MNDILINNEALAVVRRAAAFYRDNPSAYARSGAVLDKDGRTLMRKHTSPGYDGMMAMVMDKSAVQFGLSASLFRSASELYSDDLRAAHTIAHQAFRMVEAIVHRVLSAPFWMGEMAIKDAPDAAKFLETVYFMFAQEGEAQ